MRGRFATQQEVTLQVKKLQDGPGRIELGCDDPNITPAVGLVTVAELDRVVGIRSRIDAVVGRLARPGARGRPYGAGDVVLGFAESQLAGGDFMVDVDSRRADSAGAQLRAVSMPPASTTIATLARRFAGKGLVRLALAVAGLVRAFFEILPEAERARLARIRPTLDVDPTEVETYGKRKEGFAWNYQGQWAGRPCPVVWAEAGLVLTAKLLQGNQDPRPPARRLVRKALAALPDGLGRARFRFDSGFFDHHLAEVCLDAGADYAMAVPRNQGFWTAVRAVAEDVWVPAKDMTDAEVAEAPYRPKCWPGAPRSILRRVRVDAADIKTDPRSRRLRTFDKAELAAVREGRADHAWSYSMIITSLEGDLVDIEQWFRERAQVEERLKDSKLGMALRHLPSGYKVVNAVWMWSAFLALDVASVLSAFARAQQPDDVEDSEDLAGVAAADAATDRGLAQCAEGVSTTRRPRRRRPLRAHGKRLRREIINVPGRLAHHARGLIVHLHPSQDGGPLVGVYAALVALRSYNGP